MLFKRFALAAAVAAFAIGGTQAQATTLFSENFDAEVLGEGTSVLNYTDFDQFTVTTGSVDLILGDSNPWGISCSGGGGGCIDLDGSMPGLNPTSDILSIDLNFIEGMNYEVSFAFSGNQRNAADDAFFVQIGDGSDFSQTFTGIGANDPFTTYTGQFVASSTGLAGLNFGVEGDADNIGVILDDISVRTIEVSEPSTLILMGLGFGLLASRRLRKRT